MCGISGIASFSGDPKLIQSLPDLLNTIKHRGPDDEGYAYFSKDNFLTLAGTDTPENVTASELNYTPKHTASSITSDFFLGFGHRRLSIIDLTENGHQPMCDESANYWITYNGEVYNFQALREELSAKGHRFLTSSDTEVLLKSYLEWGEACLHKLNGMWAFAIYDRKKNTIFCARDRFGVKPFYYILNKQYFAFSSEIKALLQVPDFTKELNREAVFDYLALGKAQAEEEGFFKNILELNAGHCCTLNLHSQKFKLKKYYTLEYETGWQSFNPTQLDRYKNEIAELVFKAIKLRLISDVKTGTCLSGGLDSSIIACTINEIIKAEKVEQIGDLQEVFTAVYPDTTVDESTWAEMVVNSTQTHWNKTIPTSEDIINEIEKLVYIQDIPFFSTSTFSQYKVMQLIGDSPVKVTLDGQGADELFGGYPPHFAAHIFNSVKAFSPGPIINNLKGSDSNFSDTTLLTTLPIKHLLSSHFQSLFKKNLLNRQPELKHVNEDLWSVYSKRLKLFDDHYSSNLNQLLAWQFGTYGLKHLLRTSDRNSMAFSIESRMPFSDDINLIEHIFKISGAYKIRNGTGKFLLRESCRDLLPHEIYARRDKIGFATPEKLWFKELGDYFSAIINEQTDDEYVNWNNFKTEFGNIYANAVSTSTLRLWRFINFAVWRKIYNI